MVARSIVLKINWKSNINGREPVNRITDSMLINRILVYSAIKIRANIPSLYSTLNPDTSSDSPSAKSNGVRLVSARFVINHIRKRGIIISIIQVLLLSIFKSIDLWRIITDKIIRAMETSYEIVCAIPRRAPNKAYLELEHQPAINVVYTFILETQRKYKTPYMKNDEGLEWGYSVHNSNARIRPRIGANIYGDMLAGVGLVCSFVNSLMASAKGWGRPISMTLLGPLRSWK